MPLHLRPDNMVQAVIADDLASSANVGFFQRYSLSSHIRLHSAIHCILISCLQLHLLTALIVLPLSQYAGLWPKGSQLIKMWSRWHVAVSQLQFLLSLWQYPLWNICFAAGVASCSECTRLAEIDPMEAVLVCRTMPSFFDKSTTCRETWN